MKKICEQATQSLRRIRDWKKGIRPSSFDEYHTTYDSIEILFDENIDAEYLRGRVIYCFADDYRISNFPKYFKDNFNKLGIKKLIATNYGEEPYIYTYDGINEVVKEGIEDGSYEHYGYILDEEKPICITNPPFSLYKFIGDFLEEHNADFILFGTLHSLDHFSRLNDIYATRARARCTSPYEWVKEPKSINAQIWFTNIKDAVKSSTTKTKFGKRLDEIKKYAYAPDGTLCIYRSSDFPEDYYEPVLVPISFICMPTERREQFEIRHAKRACPPNTYKRFEAQRIRNI